MAIVSIEKAITDCCASGVGFERAWRNDVRAVEW